MTDTIAYPTVTVLPSSLHRQLGPARFLSEAMEGAEEAEEEGATGASETQTRSTTKTTREREREKRLPEDSGLEPDLLPGLTSICQSVCV